MRFVRMLLAVAGLLALAACSQSTMNAAGVWVQVSPSTVAAGGQTQISASCGENANSATVSSPVFGSVTLQPVAGMLGTTVTVPADTMRGTYDVRLECATGSTAITTLTVLGAGEGSANPTMHGPNTGGGFLATGGGGIDKGQWIWLGAGVACLIAAVALSVRAKRPRVTVPKHD